MFYFFSKKQKVDAPTPSKPASKKARKYEGKDIREVWDWRLSKGNPVLYTNGPTWVIRIWCNKTGKLLHEHVTDFPTTGTVEDLSDYETISKCYEWLYSVRDSFSRRAIEELKPKVAKINKTNKMLAEAFKS